MPFRDEIPEEAKYRNKRRGERLNSRVPIKIEWEADDGKTFHAHASTRIVNPYGCLVVLPHNLRIEQRVRLTNLVNQRSTPAVVVWKGSERPEGWELGIELIDPQMDFWGLEL